MLKCFSNLDEVRVSSQAMRLTDFSVLMACSVMSDKLPIGVLTMYKVPFMIIHSHQKYLYCWVIDDACQKVLGVANHQAPKQAHPSPLF